MRVSGAEKSAFVERLQLILLHWPSADRLARATGVSPSAFRKWLKGEAEPSRERLVALARVAGVGIAWLAEGDGPQPSFEPMAGTRKRLSQRPQGEVSEWANFMLLHPHNGSEPPVDHPFMALRQDWVRSVCHVEPDQLMLEIAIGESMFPTIRSGHAMLVDASDRTFRELGIYLLSINGQRLVKRVQRKHDGTLVLISDNLAYQPDVVDKTVAATVEVIGRVVWSGGAL